MLSLIIRVNLEFTEDIITATAVLHNVCTRNNDQEPSLTAGQKENYNASMAAIPGQLPETQDFRARNIIVTDYFGTMRN